MPRKSPSQDPLYVTAAQLKQLKTASTPAPGYLFLTGVPVILVTEEEAELLRIVEAAMQRLGEPAPPGWHEKALRNARAFGLLPREA